MKQIINEQCFFLLIFLCALIIVFSDSDAEGEDLAQPEFRGLWEEGAHKVSFVVVNSINVVCCLGVYIRTGWGKGRGVRRDP